MAIPFAVRIPFIEQIGCEMQRYENGEAEITLDVQDQHTNSFGVAHGGLMMTLLDVAMAHAARSLNLDQPDGGPGLVTIEMKTTFMRPGLGQIKAVGSVLHSTASMAFTEGKVLDSKGRVCAHATATFKFLRALPVSDREVRPAAKPLLQGPGSD
ncbi:MAG: PaaI family thioesterase [Aquabacterium sp.]|uniref:PaaI family thioesterase n=1 Tax=Aquabacterium sp. TaxID=1872578 RepID=UPI001225AC2E|nr:PaaI family thioesterase [Aquabacterium sp.]TAK84742.1 MAG: PaaI family thioesterase [Aquabacterium sp.]